MTLDIVTATDQFQSPSQTSYDFSVTLVAGRWIVIDYASAAAATPNTPTVSGGGLTWVSAEVTVVQSLRRIGRAYAWTGAVSGAQTITIDYGGQTQTWCSIYPCHIDGADLSDPFVNGNSLSVASGGATSVEVALNAFASSDNRPLVFFWKRQPSESFVLEGGYTALGAEQDQEADNTTRQAWHASTPDTTPSASWTTSIQNAAIASEVNVTPPAPKVMRRLLIKSQAVHRASRW